MKTLWLTALTALLLSCNGNQQQFDATGTFEAVETIIPAEASGIIEALDVEEGQNLLEGQVVGLIDTTQLSLKKDQLLAQIKAVKSRKPDAQSQLDILREQLLQARVDQHRMQNLLKADAATQKQVDDANSRVAILEKQIKARDTELNINTTGIDEEAQTMTVQIKQVNDQLKKSKIVNNIKGTVISKYAEKGEMAINGKPLYKIADLSTLILRVYVSGGQLPGIKLNKQVKVYVDAENNSYREYPGVVQWISDKAEFTPKTIQTKDERANLVYAVKVKVKNNGFLKIGMYGEIKL